jgi:hypothetical protein
MGERSAGRVVRVRERDVAIVGAVAGVVAAGITAFADGPAPTGGAIVDRLLVGLAVGIVTWASASAQWWLIASLGAVAAGLAASPAAFIAGVVGIGIAGRVGAKRRSLAVQRAAATGLALVALCDTAAPAGTDPSWWFHGLTAAIALPAATVVAIAGLRRRHKAVRRRAILVASGVGGLGVLAVLGFGLTAARAAQDVVDANRLARDGIAQVDDGDYTGAAASLGAAAELFDRADAALSRPWAAAGRLIPVVAQHQRAASRLADEAAAATADVASAVGAVDPQRLRLDGGRFDLAAITDTTTRLETVGRSLGSLRTALDEVDSPWLVEGLRVRIDDLANEVDAQLPRLDNAVTAGRLAPALLGGSGTRRYFVALTTPAEARGHGGFMGNFVEITARDGRVSMTRSGRTGELNAAGDGARLDGPDDWLARYGRYGFTNGSGGTVRGQAWSNVMISPHFPSTAAVIDQLYPQSGGVEIDGVFALDVYVLAAMLEWTGPLDVPGVPVPIGADNAVDFLLYEQYELDDPERVDVLGELVEITFDTLLAGALPEPTTIARSLGPLADAGRLTGWSAAPDEQDLFTRIRIDGGLPDVSVADGFAVTVTNAAPNKLDVYLARRLEYRASVDSDGTVMGTVRVTLRNEAPSSGLAPVVIGNSMGDPPGTNRMLVSIYTAFAPGEATIDGEPLGGERGVEAGWYTTDAFVVVPPGGERTITVTVTGRLPAVTAFGTGAYALRQRPLPLVLPEEHDVLVVDDQGEPVLERRGPQSVRG